LELIATVQQCYEDCPISKLKQLWITLQAMCNEIVTSAGDNNFKMPHMNKEKLEREGQLPAVLDVDPTARHHLDA